MTKGYVQNVLQAPLQIHQVRINAKVVQLIPFQASMALQNVHHVLLDRLPLQAVALVQHALQGVLLSKVNVNFVRKALSQKVKDKQFVKSVQEILSAISKVAKNANRAQMEASQ